MTARMRSDQPIAFFRGLVFAAAPSLLLWGMIVLAVRGIG
jgi:hypothetical protein